MPSSLRPARLLLLGALGLGGCVRLGPDFQSPGEAWVEQWHSPAIEQSSQQRPGPDIREWWRVFDDPVLDRLIEQAAAQNLSLLSAAVQILQARAQLGIAVGNQYPQTQNESKS